MRDLQMQMTTHLWTFQHQATFQVPHNNNDDGDPVAVLGGAVFCGTAEGHSFLREWMANRVESKQLTRPAANVVVITRKRSRPEDLDDLLVAALAEGDDGTTIGVI
jgi:hypothetical protein